MIMPLRPISVSALERYWPVGKFTLILERAAKANLKYFYSGPSLAHDKHSGRHMD